MRILIVEDDNGFASLLSRIVQPLDPNPDRAGTWEAAKALIFIDPCYDVIILDIFLEISGPETLSKIKLIKNRCEATIIIVVSGQVPADKLKLDAMHAGADVVIPKTEFRQRAFLISMAEAFAKKEVTAKTLKQTLEIHEAAIRLLADRIKESQT